MTALGHILQDIPVFSVSEVSQSLKLMVEKAYGRIRVRGEISGLKRHSSGHTYFALKDTEAVMDAVMWRGSFSGGGVALEEGLEIIATGRLTTYPGRSKYQMVVEQFEPTGQGALLKLLEERKGRLAAEGLFEASRKKPLPLYPQKIGIVTSPTGAVLQDILHRLEDRYPCHVLVWPVLVQGQGAAEQIAAAIEGFNRLPDPPDVIIVARGGGSLEDLWAFNEEIVVRAAAQSDIPLISAVGHETDTTLIDYAADRRAPTPTAAAEIAVPVLMNLWQFLQDRHQRLTAVMAQDLIHRQTTLIAVSRGLPDLTYLIENKIQRLDEWSERLAPLVRAHIQTLGHRLLQVTQYLRHPQETITIAEQKCFSLIEQFRHGARRIFEATFQRFELITHRLDHASYQSILNRGFCWTTDAKGTFMTRASQIKKGAALKLHYIDGLVSVVESSVPAARGNKSLSDERQRKLL
ncbi:MAG: exodeoxyribonuclease VII large subunit [Alphaproteobacteria bacterium]|nr:exodeoxyribonuclease VII large subunit [Alphaproteobacteria bacterium]